jgi:hypothetical protein
VRGRRPPARRPLLGFAAPGSLSDALAARSVAGLVTAG